MREMHSFQNSRQFEIPSPNFQNALSARSLFTLIYEIGEWTQSVPLTFYNEREENDVLYALWDDIVFFEDDIWQMFAADLAALSPRWKIDIFSTASPTQETVWMSLSKDERHFYAVQKTLSGQPADVCQSLLLRIRCSSAKEANGMQALLRSASQERGIAAMDWKYSAFLSKEKMMEPVQNSRFCYVSVFEDTQPADYLKALRPAQKTALWTDFLTDGFDYAEFEWLYDEISQNMLANRIEWEFSLHTAMETLNYTVRTSPHDFKLYDGQGKPRYFSFNSSRYSERAFLKILFPLNRENWGRP